MKKITLLSLAMLLLLAFVPSEVRADGITIRIESNAFALQDETAQVAAINYEDGREKLLLATKLGQLTSGPMVWIVPIPARASEVKIDVCQEFPQFYGEDVLQEAERDKEVMGEIAGYMAMTQIWTGIFVPNIGRFLGAEGAERVQVYARVEKEGITAEVITAETGYALDEYLEGKRVTVPSGSIPVIDEYIGKNYSFVVSWVESRPTKRKDVTPAIFVEFPTDKLYYPLRLTSAYGSRRIPIQLTVLGYVKPDLYPEIERFTKCRYFYFYRASGGPAGFYGKAFGSYETSSRTDWLAVDGAKFTTIEIGNAGGSILKGRTPQAKNFVDDLWMKSLDDLPREVTKVIDRTEKRAQTFRENWLVLFIPWLFCLSLVSGALAGFILYRKPKKFALIGLANCLTLISLIVATIAEAKKEGKRVRFILLFSALFLGLDIALIPLLRYILFL